ncbi:MAG TPA: RNA methyltransferase [Bacteroidota bacterium]|nr:RNA methyltransferase [Bacteroidota bacterium]
MKKLSHEEIARHRFSSEQLQREERLPIYALLDNVRSLYNVGSMFRTADGARIAKMVLCGYTPSPPRKEIEKTALGATTTVPWEHMKDPQDALRQLKSLGIPLCVLEQTDTSTPYHSLRKTDFPLCLVVGNEITGVRKEILDQADRAIEIPMYGMKQSLNVAVAFGIAVFDFVRILRTPGP